MDIRKSAILFLAFFLLSGCNTNPSLQSGRSLATLMLTPQVVEASYLTQSVVSNYTKANINHLVVKLFKSEVQVSAKDVPYAVLDTAVAFTNLAANSTYQVRCYAYNAAGTAPANLISLDDSNSYTDVTVSNEDRPVFSSAKVKLIDSPFGAQGTTSIAVTGGIYSTIGSASLDPVIATVAGNGTASFSGDGGAATNAAMNQPVGLAFDSAGNLYIADNANSRIRKVTIVTGIITTVAGNGTAGFSGDGGAATSAAIRGPHELALDGAGNLYIADAFNNRIRKVTIATGIITTVVGTGATGSVGDGGAATSAQLNCPVGVSFDSAGNLYVTEYYGHRVRKVTTATGIITTVAGNGTAGFSGDGGAATSAAIKNPFGGAFDGVGNFYIADSGNHRIRKVTTATGVITTVAGTGATGSVGDGGTATSAQLNSPSGVALDSAGNLYVSEYSGQRIRKVTTVTGIITTVAGSGTAGFSGDGGAATNAQVYTPRYMAFDSAGNLYIADQNNRRIRIVF